MMRVVNLVATFVLFSVLLTGCVLDSGPEDGSNIKSIDVEPNKILFTDTSMVDQTVDVTVKVGFEVQTVDKDHSYVFIRVGGEQRKAAHEAVDVKGSDTIVFKKIKKAFFQDLQVGEYHFGVHLKTATGSIESDSSDQGTFTISK